MRARVGAEATRARGVSGVGGTGSIWFGPVVSEAWDRALVSGDQLWAVVGLILQPALSFSSRGQNKDTSEPKQQYIDSAANNNNIYV